MSIFIFYLFFVFVFLFLSVSISLKRPLMKSTTLVPDQENFYTILIGFGVIRLIYFQRIYQYTVRWLLCEKFAVVSKERTQKNIRVSESFFFIITLMPLPHRHDCLACHSWKGNIFT